MKAGERISLITESARLLETREWPELDLILSQHKMPTSNDASSDKYAYVIEMIENSEDEDLRELHSYLVGDVEAASTDDQTWAQGKLKLFVSHLAVHQAFIGKVSYSLSFEGVSAFVAHTSIEPSREWESVIEAALRSCEAMVIFLHKGFHESKWCDQEVGFALARRIPILIIAIDEMPYGFMSKFQALKADKLHAASFAPKITEWLISTPTAQEPMTNGLVTAFEDSGSYDRTRRLITLLQMMPRFTPAQLDRLDKASKTNPQIYDTNLNGILVPDLIKALIIKNGGTPEPPAVDDESYEPPF
jgi:hypothetical protein